MLPTCLQYMDFKEMAGIKIYMYMNTRSFLLRFLQVTYGHVGTSTAGISQTLIMRGLYCLYCWRAFCSKLSWGQLHRHDIIYVGMVVKTEFTFREHPQWNTCNTNLSCNYSVYIVSLNSLDFWCKFALLSLYHVMRD